MKLSTNTLRYFEVQDKKYNHPVCTVYIDAHGGEELHPTKCRTDTSTVYSLAGILGAVAYADESDRNGVKMPDSRFHRELMTNRAKTTRKLKEEMNATALELKGIVARHFRPEESDDNVDKWTKRHFDEYALKPMKQLFHKTYEFIHSQKEDKNYYEFGVYIQDITYPPGWPSNASQERQMEHLNKLKGVNVISNDFVSQGEFPEAIAFLKELESSGNHRYHKEHRIMDDTFLSQMTFEEVIELLTKLGFQYSYIFDDSCRSNPLVKQFSPTMNTQKMFRKIADRERRTSSLKYRPSLRSKIKSANPKKLSERKRSKKSADPKKLSKRNSMEKIVDTRKRLFREKVVSKVEEIFESFTFGGMQLDLEKIADIPRSILFHLSFDDEILYSIEIVIDFLKVVRVKILEKYAPSFEVWKDNDDEFDEIDKEIKQFIKQVRNVNSYK